MDSELQPGPGFERLFERADAAGQCDECVAGIGHQLLALVHRTGDMQPCQRFVRNLAVAKEVGDHADDLAAAGQRRVGQLAHQSDPAAAEHDTDRARSELTAERGGSGAKFVRAGP